MGSRRKQKRRPGAITRALDAFRSMQGVASDDEGEEQPMEIICYALIK